MGFPGVKPDQTRPAANPKPVRLALLNRPETPLTTPNGDKVTLSPQATAIASNQNIKNQWQDEFNARIDYARKPNISSPPNSKTDDKIVLFYLPGTQKAERKGSAVLAGEFYVVIIPNKNPKDWYIQNYIPTVTGGPKSASKDKTATPTPTGSFPITGAKGSYTTNRWTDAVIPQGATFAEGKSGEILYTDPRDNKQKSANSAYFEHFEQRLPLSPEFKDKWKKMSPTQRKDAIMAETQTQLNKIGNNYLAKGRPYLNNPFGSVAVTLGGRAGEMGVMIHDVAAGAVAKDNDTGSHGCIHLPDLGVPEVRELVQQAREIHVAPYAAQPAEEQNYANTMGFLRAKLGPSQKS